MLIIAGVSPKTKTLDQTPRLCPRCGLVQAHLERVDHYFSLFFIPLIRVKTGAPVLRCRRCEQWMDPTGPPGEIRPESSAPVKTCRACGRPLAPGFRFCPNCGKPT